MFLPIHRPAIAGLEIAGMMQPARGVSGDYYDYIPIDEHTIQIVIADVAGKGDPAALLMSATAAAIQLEASEKRDMLEVVNRLNSCLHSVSDSNRYVTCCWRTLMHAASPFATSIVATIPPSCFKPRLMMLFP